MLQAGGDVAVANAMIHGMPVDGRRGHAKRARGERNSIKSSSPTRLQIGKFLIPKEMPLPRRMTADLDFSRGAAVVRVGKLAAPFEFGAEKG